MTVSRIRSAPRGAWFAVVWMLAACAGGPRPATPVAPTSSAMKAERAEAAGDCEAAQEVVRRFLELDATTGREWSEQLTALITDEDGPGWDHNLVITRYELGGCRLQDSAFQVGVTYHVFGELGAREGTGEPAFTPASRLETHVFSVVSGHGGLKVDRVGDVPPHIYVSTALTRLEELERTADIEATRAAARAARNQLKGVSAP